MFNTKFPIYGLMITIAIISGLIVVYKNAKKQKYKQEEIVGLLIYIALGTIFGAKYFTFIINYEKYGGIFDFSKIGLSSYGAIIGIIILVLLFSKQFKKSFSELLIIILPAIPLMYGIGKIGCFLTGCCYGIEYNKIFNVVYNYSSSAPQGISLFPIQLLEAIIFIIIFLFINKDKKPSIAKMFILCGSAKFLLDFLRMSHTNLILSVNQIISIIFIIIGLYLAITKTRYLDK